MNFENSEQKVLPYPLYLVLKERNEQARRERRELDVEINTIEAIFRSHNCQREEKEVEKAA